MPMCLLLTVISFLSILLYMAAGKRERLLTIALDVFFKHGYKRVEMKEIAEVAGISRPGLYLYFKTKEEIFSAAILHYAETKIVEISQNLEIKKTVEAKLQYAFEVWCIRTFDRSVKSPEAKEVSDSTLEFARESLEISYENFEAIVASVLKSHRKSGKNLPTAGKTAHLLVSASRGFKLVAKNSSELRKMIHDLLKMLL